MQECTHEVCHQHVLPGKRNKLSRRKIGCSAILILVYLDKESSSGNVKTDGISYSLPVPNHLATKTASDSGHDSKHKQETDVG